MRGALAAAFLLIGATAAAETFHMKDGSVFEGTIVAVRADDLEVSIAGKVLVIRKDSVGWIDYEPEWDGKTMRAGELIVKVGLGAALPLAAQGFHQLARPGLASEISGLVQLDKHVGLGVRLDQALFTVAYPEVSFVNGLGNGPGTKTGFQEKANVIVSSLMLEARYAALPGRRISPFVAGGLGFNVYAQRLEATPKPNSGGWGDDGSYGPRVREDAAAGFAAELGTGVQFLLSRHYLAELSARWHYAAVDGAKFGLTGAQAVSLLATLGWRF